MAKIYILLCFHKFITKLISLIKVFLMEEFDIHRVSDETTLEKFRKNNKEFS